MATRLVLSLQIRFRVDVLCRAGLPRVIVNRDLLLHRRPCAHRALLAVFQPVVDAAIPLRHTGVRGD